jgi:tetratricopeptide (TPR) repeat protein
MPFVTHELRSTRGVAPCFVGRVEERRLFQEQVLAPDVPAIHVLNISGPPGVGISTLLARWREDAQTTPACLTAFADGRVGSPLRVMTTYAAQLRAAGTPMLAFEQALDHLLTTASRPFPVEQQVARTLFIRQVRSLAGTEVVQGLPVIGSLYEAVSEQHRRVFLQRNPLFQIHSRQPFAERLAALTRAFVDDLTWITTTPTRMAPPRGLRIILFLDELTTAVSELLTWLRTQVLPAPLSTQVVLVLAGPDPLEPILAPEPEIISLPIQPFTVDETRAYLAACGTTDPDRVETLWTRSGGLPLLLALLAPVPPAQLATEEDALTLGIRWIAQQEVGFRALVQYAALLATSIHPRDLAVCPRFSAQDSLRWSRALTDLPVLHTHPVTGEQTLHPQVAQQAREDFAHDMPLAYQQALRALAHHYQRQLEELTALHGEAILANVAGQDLALALLTQWFWLADEESLRQALELVLHLDEQTEDLAALTHLLRTLAQAPSSSLLPEAGKQVAGWLLAEAEADLEQPAFLEALTGLLALVETRPDFPAVLRARLLCRRAAACLLQEQPHLALEDSLQAGRLDSTSASAWLVQGMALAALGRAREAIAAYDQALACDPQAVFARAHRGLAQRARRAYEQAVEESSKVLALVPDLPEAAAFYRLTYGERDARRRGLSNFDYRVEQNPGDAQSYLFQGMAHCALGHHAQALASFAQALALDPANPRIYAGRGHVLLAAGNLEQAQADLERSWELDPHDGSTGLLLAWVRLCRGEPDIRVSAWLDMVATRSKAQNIAQICHGLALLLRQRFEEARASLDQALQEHPEQPEALFWKGVACVFLQRDEEALTSLKQASSTPIPLPAALFTPLHRVAAARPEFYQQQILPLLQARESRSSAV